MLSALSTESGGAGRSLLLWATLTGFASHAAAQAPSTVVDLDGRSEAVLDAGLEYRIVRAGGPDTPEDVSRAPFEASSAEGLNLGYTTEAVWLRFFLQTTERHRWALEVDMPALDEVDVYFERADGRFEAHAAGDRRPVTARDRATPAFTFDIPAREGPMLVLVRVQTEGVLSVPLRVVRQDRLQTRLAQRGALTGLFLGMLLALALYNLLLSVIARNAGYGWYGALLLTICLFIAARSGYAAVYLWPNATDFAHRAPTLFVLLAVAVAARFVPFILESERTMPRLHRLFAPLSAVSLALVPGTWLFYGVTIRALTVLVLAFALVLPPMIALAWRRGSISARYFAVAHAVMSLGVTLVALRSFGLVPSNLFTEHLMTIGACLEALLLSLALADRIRRLGVENERTQRALVSAKRDALEAQRSFTGQLLRAQDGERQRIASDLHDGLGQSLLALLTHLRQKEKTDASLTPLASVAHDSVGELREIARGLHPARLDRLGVADAIRATASGMLESHGTAHEVVIEDIDGCVPATSHLHLYRIAQEALANVVRHSDAEEVEVTLRAEDEHVVFCIRDDGEGDAGALREGVGLSSIRARARAIGATMHVGRGLAERGIGLRIEVPRVE
ncbi:MAG: 7TM diverse intracellular signaling domain-containing protein [Sandaracinaceae bacterium]